MLSFGETKKFELSASDIRPENDTELEALVLATILATYPNLTTESVAKLRDEIRTFVDDVITPYEIGETYISALVSKASNTDTETFIDLRLVLEQEDWNKPFYLKMTTYFASQKGEQ